MMFGLAAYNYHESSTSIRALSQQKFLINRLALQFERHVFDTSHIAFSYAMTQEASLLKKYKDEVKKYSENKQKIYTRILDSVSKANIEEMKTLTIQYLESFDDIYKEVIQLEGLIFKSVDNLRSQSSSEIITINVFSNIEYEYNKKLAKLREFTDSFISKSNQRNNDLLALQQAHINACINQGLLASTLLLLVLIGFYYFLSRYFIKPIYKLSRAHQKISDASEHPLVKCDSPIDEIKFIVSSYNIMAKNVSSHLKELKALLKTSEHLKQQAEYGSKAKTQFVANISHELRTPLNSIFGYCELLIGTQLNQEQYELMKPIMTSSQKLLMIINELLDFAKIQEKTIDIKPYSAPIENTLTDVINSTGSLVDETVDFSIYVAKDVPINITIDHKKLFQILVNLIGNALKFTKEGSVKLWLNIDDNPKTKLKELSFTILDTGIGIDDKQLARIFEPFYQLENKASRKYGGTGLGLTISNEIIQAMHGRLNITSTTHKGTVCQCYLPYTSKNERTFGDITLHENIQLYLLVSNSTYAEEFIKYINRHTKHIVQLNEKNLKSISILNNKKNVFIVEQMLLHNLTLQQKQNLKERFSLVICIERIQTHHDTKYKGYYDTIMLWPFLISYLVRYINNFERVNLKQKNSLSPSLIPQTHNSQLQGKFILLAEDVVINQAFVVKAIEKAGGTINCAINGTEVLDMLDKTHYDIILMDLHMPIMDGFETTRIIRQNKKYNDVKIIALSADAQNSIIDKCTNLGMDDFITKPFSNTQLISVINKLCQ